MPKDGTVHELTSNVGAAWDRGRAGGSPGPRSASAHNRPGLPSEPEPRVGSELAATVFTWQPQALDVPVTQGVRWEGPASGPALTFVAPSPCRPSFSCSSCWTSRRQQVPCWPPKVLDTSERGPQPRAPPSSLCLEMWG